MKKLKIYVLSLIIATLASSTFVACKKGSDDPAVSFVSRKDRFTNTWTLVKYEKNGTPQDLSGTSYVYNAFKDGKLTQTIEGSIFGFATKTSSNGTWSFLNDDEDVKIIISNSTTIYNIQRLASKELWLKNTSGNDTYIYYFEGL